MGIHYFIAEAMTIPHSEGGWGLIPTIGTFVGILSAIIAAVWGWRRAKLEVPTILVDAASDVVLIQKNYIEQQDAIISKMQEQIKLLQEQEARLEELIKQLRKQNEELLIQLKGYKKLEARMKRCEAHHPEDEDK